MKSLRFALLSAILLLGGSAFAYDGFTVGLQAGVHRNYVGYNVHAVVPLTSFSLGTEPTRFSLRADFAAGDLLYVGAGAVLSGTGSGLQPFASVGAGAAFWADRPQLSFQGIIGVRVPLYQRLYAVTQVHLHLGTVRGQALPGFGIGLEYSF